MKYQISSTAPTKPSTQRGFHQSFCIRRPEPVRPSSLSIWCSAHSATTMKARPSHMTIFFSSVGALEKRESTLTSALSPASAAAFAFSGVFSNSV